MPELIAYTMLAVLVIVLLLTRIAMELEIREEREQAEAVYRIEFVDAHHVRLIKVKE